MTRFRPNFVIDGDLEAWAEDHWQHIHIGGVHFQFLKYCTRCIMININPDTGQRAADNQPFATLQQHHFSGKAPTFGIHLIARNSGRIAQGDPVTIQP